MFLVGPARPPIETGEKYWRLRDKRHGSGWVSNGSETQKVSQWLQLDTVAPEWVMGTPESTNQELVGCSVTDILPRKAFIRSLSSSCFIRVLLPAKSPFKRSLLRCSDGTT